jgi:hypothetical protein
LKFCRLRFLFHELLVLRRWLLMNSFWPEDPRLLPVFFWFFFLYTGVRLTRGSTVLVSVLSEDIISS